MLIVCNTCGYLAPVAIKEGEVTQVQRFFVDDMLEQNLIRFCLRLGLRWDLVLCLRLRRYQSGRKNDVRRVQS